MIAQDLRMICLVFDRLGLQSEFAATTCSSQAARGS